MVYSYVTELRLQSQSGRAQQGPRGTRSPSLSPSEGSKDKGAVSPPKQKAVMPNAKEAD